MFGCSSEAWKAEVTKRLVRPSRCRAGWRQMVATLWGGECFRTVSHRTHFVYDLGKSRGELHFSHGTFMYSGKPFYGHHWDPNTESPALSLKEHLLWRLPLLRPGGLLKSFFPMHTKDEALRDELATHLRLLERQGVIAGWHDRRILAGHEWAGVIDTYLQTAHIILLLVSADFLASDYCYDIEVQRAMARHEAGEARVIPVILRAVDWHSAPFGKLQALPKDGHPVTSWANHDEALLDVARGIRVVAQEMIFHP
jgi:hypothetical protein